MRFVRLRVLLTLRAMGWLPVALWVGWILFAALGGPARSTAADPQSESVLILGLAVISACIVLAVPAARGRGLSLLAVGADLAVLLGYFLVGIGCTLLLRELTPDVMLHPGRLWSAAALVALPVLLVHGVGRFHPHPVARGVALLVLLALQFALLSPDPRLDHRVGAVAALELVAAGLLFVAPAPRA